MKFVLGNYLRRRVAGQMLALLLALSALMQLIELLEVTTDVLDRGLGAAGIARYALLRLPSQLEIMLPLAGLLGSMRRSMRWRAHEISRAALGGHRTDAGDGLPAAVAVCSHCCTCALTQKLVPLAKTPCRAGGMTPCRSRTACRSQWVRTSGGILLFQRHSSDGRRLLDVRIFTRGEDGLLALRTHAYEARWEQPGEWQLYGARDLAVQPGAASLAGAERSWRSNLTPDDVVQLDAAPSRTSRALISRR